MAGSELGGDRACGRPPHPPASHALCELRRQHAQLQRERTARLMADITMPQLGETVTEGTITKWFKSVGDETSEDDPVFEVSTDKVDSEVPSPESGYLAEILVEEGDTVDVGTKLAVISSEAPSGDGQKSEKSDEKAEAAEAPEEEPEEQQEEDEAAEDVPEDEDEDEDKDEDKASEEDEAPEEESRPAKAEAEAD